MRMRHAAVLAGLVLGLMSTTAQAIYIVDIEQVNGNVVATGSGSIDTAGLPYENTQPLITAIFSSQGFLTFGPNNSNNDFYGPVSGPLAFGTGGLTQASSSTGSVVGVDGGAGGGPVVLLPQGYTSGTPLGISIDTFSNTTIEGLGLVPNSSFTYTLPSDTFIVNVGSDIVSTVPLPASAPMFGAALLALGAVGYGVKRKKAAAAA